MNKFLAVLIAAMFAVVTTGSFAADSMKKDEMAKSEMKKDEMKKADKPAKKAKKAADKK